MAEKDPNIVTFDYKGKSFEANGKALTDYRVIKRMARVETDPAGYFESLELIFLGHDEEYMEILGGSATEMEGLYSAAAKAVSAAKNS